MIGYYVHHHGAGHLHRVRSVAQHLREPLTVLSSVPRPAACRLPWVQLPRDDSGADPSDPTARGTLHWVPLRDDGLRSRMARIGAWIDENAPSLLVTDVSVEVALLGRLLGVPSAVVALPGDRTDPAHRLAYDLAEVLVACWPSTVRTDWPDSWAAKTEFVGAFSRFDDAARPVVPTRSDSGKRRVTVLLGAGGSDITRPQINEAIAATPAWHWDVLGGPVHGWHPDPWPLLCGADVVITHAGQNAIAEVAAARAPAIVIPQARPHDEQHATAGALADLDLALTLDRWPSSDAWPELLERAGQLGGLRWSKWSTGCGAAAAAAVLDRLAGTAREVHR